LPSAESQQLQLARLYRDDYHIAMRKNTSTTKSRAFSGECRGLVSLKQHEIAELLAIIQPGLYDLSLFSEFNQLRTINCIYGTQIFFKRHEKLLKANKSNELEQSSSSF
jgi:hypothetical protein